jgi:GT2 family glycosyltransferase
VGTSCGQKKSLVPELLWLLVAYGNMPEVDRYVDDLRRLPHSEQFRFAICDNSSVPTPSRHAGAADVDVVIRPDNPGYLEGALVAMESATARGAAPDWVALSNTDLEICSGNPLDALREWRPDSPVVIAPRITEGAGMTEKNPHLVRPRTLRRHAINAKVTSMKAGALAYTALHAVRWKISQALGTSRHDTTEWDAAHPDGTRFYSPYGALMFFSRGFFEAGGLPHGVPLLAEEYFIAETARELGAPVVFAPAIHVHHTPHSTTGPKVTRLRADLLTTAFRAVHDHARTRRDVSR